MRLLLPPSEGKTPPRRGTPVDLATMNRAALRTARSEVSAALADASSRPDALSVLGVGASLGEEVARNADPLAPAAPAERVYSGVLFEAFGISSLRGTALRRARASSLVFSARFGVVSLTDRIPAYRLSMGTSLPGIGPLGSYWKRHLTPLLDAETDGELLVDARSGTYQAAWKAPAERTVQLRIFTLVGGEKKVITHMAKKTRGDVARHLCESATPLPSSPAALLDVVAQRWEVELTEPGRTRPGHLDIVVPSPPSYAGA